MLSCIYDCHKIRCFNSSQPIPRLIITKLVNERVDDDQEPDQSNKNYHIMNWHFPGLDI